MTGRPADPGLNADLATLRDLKGRVLTEDEDVQFDSATNGVEAELSRLREDASALDSRLTAAQDECATLREERDAWKQKHIDSERDWRKEWLARDAAEARCARLQQMLGAAFRECEDDISVVACDCDVDPEATCLAHRILALAGDTEWAA